MQKSKKTAYLVGSLPANASSFYLSFEEQSDSYAKISGSWYTGTDSFSGTRIVRKSGSYPDNPNDGSVVYEGSLKTFTDTYKLWETTYYYRAFTYNDQKQYQTTVSSGARAVITPINKVLQYKQIADDNSTVHTYSGQHPATFGDKFYFLGYASSAWHLDIYDTINNSWEKQSIATPSGINSFSIKSSISIGSKIYIFYCPLKSNYSKVYDIETGLWTTITLDTSYYNYIFQGQCATDGDDIFGYFEYENGYDDEGNSIYAKGVHTYNISTNTHTRHYATSSHSDMAYYSLGNLLTIREFVNGAMINSNYVYNKNSTSSSGLLSVYPSVSNIGISSSYGYCRGTVVDGVYYLLMDKKYTNTTVTSVPLGDSSEVATVEFDTGRAVGTAVTSRFKTVCYNGVFYIFGASARGVFADVTAAAHFAYGKLPQE